MTDIVSKLNVSLIILFFNFQENQVKEIEKTVQSKEEVLFAELKSVCLMFILI
jgi:hypothetical protein